MNSKRDGEKTKLTQEQWLACHVLHREPPALQPSHHISVQRRIIHIPLMGKSLTGTQRETHTQRQRGRETESKVPLVRASRTPLASKYLRNASFLDSLAYTNPATTYPQKQTPPPVRQKSTAACIINTNKQTNKQNWQPRNTRISQPPTQSNHQQKQHYLPPPIHRFNSPPTVPFLPSAKKKTNKKIEGRNNPIVRQSSTMQQCN